MRDAARESPQWPLSCSQGSKSMGQGKSFTAGFIAIAALATVGLALQLTIGPMDWAVLHWPGNAMALTAFITILAIVSIWREDCRVIRWMASLEAAVPSLLATGAVTAIYGITGNPSTISNWSFVLIYAFMTTSLGLTCIKRLNFKLHNIPFLLNHIGLFTVLVCAALGNADREELKMAVNEAHPQWHAVDERGFGYTPGFALRLDSFSEESFISDLTVYKPEADPFKIKISVNHPHTLDGWKIYQSGYDSYGDGAVSILSLVRDSWLPAVYVGIFMMLAGAVTLLLTKRPARK